jgi:hypothetical protein
LSSQCRQTLSISGCNSDSMASNSVRSFEKVSSAPTDFRIPVGHTGPSHQAQVSLTQAERAVAGRLGRRTARDGPDFLDVAGRPWTVPPVAIGYPIRLEANSVDAQNETNIIITLSPINYQCASNGAVTLTSIRRRLTAATGEIKVDCRLTVQPALPGNTRTASSGKSAARPQPKPAAYPVRPSAIASIAFLWSSDLKR